MKILFINSQPINRDWSTGNTFINFFENFPEDYSFHEICLRYGKVEQGFLESAIFLNELDVIKSVFNRKSVVASTYDEFIEECIDILNQQNDKVSKVYSYRDSHIVRYIGLMVRNFFWKHGKWKDAVNGYITNLQPDLIFFSTSGMKYLHRIMHYVHSITNVPVVLFHADDHFTYKCFSVNPLFWINRVSTRKQIKKAVEVSSHNFCITQLQCDEYQKAMNKPCELLTKGMPFTENVSFEQNNASKRLKFVYTGNIFYDRWKTLSYIGRLLDVLSKQGYEGELKIYSGNEPSKRIKKQFDSIKSIRFMGAVPNTEIQSIQMNSDVLIHVETFGVLQKLKVRHSFSTKIVDYLHSGKCILVAGARDIAPIQYFEENDIGLVLTGNVHTDLELLKTVFDHNVRRQYAQKAWLYGKEYHASEKVKKQLISVFSKVTD